MPERLKRSNSEPSQKPRERVQVPDNFVPEDYYKLIETNRRRWRGGPVMQNRFRARLIKQLPTSDSFERQIMLYRVLESAFNRILQTAPQNSSAQVLAENVNFRKGVIATCRINTSDLTFHHLADRLDAVFQSDDTVDLTQTTLNLTTFTTSYVGSEPKRLSMANRRVYDEREYCKLKKSLYNSTADKRLKNRQGLCVPLIIARELYAMDPKRGKGRLRNYLGSKRALAKARALVKEAGLRPSNGPFTLDQLASFAKCIPSHVSLRFFDSQSPPFINIDRGAKRSINIYIHFIEDSFHAYGIRSLNGFLSKDKVCLKCFKSDRTGREQGHKCTQAVCSLCKYVNCTNTSLNQEVVMCNRCELFFYTKKCLEAHCCEDNQICPTCNEIGPKRSMKTHECGKTQCLKCSMAHSLLDYCSVQPDKSRKKKKTIWYADAESQIHCDGEHQANLIVLQKSDGTDFKEYRGLDSMKNFVHDCIIKTSPYSDSYIVWHNASGYDAHLWWKELIRVSVPPKMIIRKGQRILSMELAQNGIVCRDRDSLQFIPGTPLAAFPKIFGLDIGSKGEFPHGLNTPQWVKFKPSEKVVYREIVGGVEHRFPRLEYFWPDQRRKGELKRLKIWHREQVQRFRADSSLLYYPEDELVKYCRQDVQILQQGFEKYRETMLKQYPELEPLDSLTFPSYNNKIFRNYFMPKNSLSLLPPEGYETNQRRVSLKSMAWLAWIERNEGLTGMRNGRKGGEVKLTRHYVDGVASKDGVIQALEFHGCRFHAHSLHECMNKKRPKWDEDLMKAYQLRSEVKDRNLKELEKSQLYGPLKYRFKWECDFDKEVAEDADLGAFYSEYEERYIAAGDPLRPRDALRGGRTNAIKFSVDPVPQGFTMYYLDFTSLYPAVNASVNGERWPLGHPDIYIGKETDWAPKKWFGLAKVEMIPPKGLLHPVLGQPFKDGKILFHLCTACAQSGVGRKCKHNEKERSIHGTFFTGEIDLAVEMGYTLSKVHEIWHWPPERTSTDLFRPMIRDQFKKKVIASPKPSDPTELLKSLAHLGIYIGDDEWDENKAMRALAKFSLNNIWGFLGARTNYENTEVVTNISRLQQLEADPNIELTRVEISEDERHLFVVSKPVKEEPGSKQNIVLAALTTAYARIALYRVLRDYPDEVVYFDTDSVFLLLPEGREPPQTSNKLGELKDEIKEEFGEGAKITRFTSIGPKCYAYTVEQNGAVVKEEIKLKGIRFTGQVSDMVDSSLFKSLTNGGIADVPQHVIKKDLFASSLRNVSMLKQIRFLCTKRYFMSEPNPMLSTVPFGYE